MGDQLPLLLGDTHSPFFLVDKILMAPQQNMGLPLTSLPLATWLIRVLTPRKAATSVLARPGSIFICSTVLILLPLPLPLLLFPLYLCGTEDAVRNIPVQQSLV